jgi:hypothetical protein
VARALTISQHIEDIPPEQMDKRAAAFASMQK